jgi:hypothetical protein
MIGLDPLYKYMFRKEGILYFCNGLVSCFRGNLVASYCKLPVSRNCALFGGIHA